jgi:mannose-6-phosphate isomerase
VPLAGLSLTEVHSRLGMNLIGVRNTWAQVRGKFPLLIKILDASDKLSVQVHPDDDYASHHEGNELGKTEMWVVLDAKPDARVILGVTSGTTRETFKRAITENDLNSYLHSLAIRTGDFVCVPSGTVHAITGRRSYR